MSDSTYLPNFVWRILCLSWKPYSRLSSDIHVMTSKCDGWPWLFLRRVRNQNLLLDHHVRPSSASTPPIPERRKRTRPCVLTVRRRRSHSGPDRLGENSVRPGSACYPLPFRLRANTCLASLLQFSASRRHTMYSRPSSTPPTQNRTLTSSTSVSSRPRSSSSSPCQTRCARASSCSTSLSGAQHMMQVSDMC